MKPVAKILSFSALLSDGKMKGLKKVWAAYAAINVIKLKYAYRD